MKKKILMILLSLAMVFNTYSMVGYADGGISVTLNGEALTFDVPPQLIDNRTMVPLRKIFEAMGAVVDWDNDTRTVTATKGNERVIATIDSKNVYISGETKTLDVPPMVVDDRTLVPVRFVAEAFGANVDWDEGTRTVVIHTKWDGVGVVPCYDKYPTIPDLGVIIGVHGEEVEVNGSEYVYQYIPEDVSPSDLSYYLSLLDDLGFVIKKGFDSLLYVCQKDDGTIVDIILFSKDNLTIGITLPKGQTITSDFNIQEFTKGFELAEFSKYNSPASENGLGNTPIYMNCIIDNTEVIAAGEQKMILGYLIDSAGCKWMCMLNTTTLDGESNFKSIIGKDIVLCGIYSGYSSAKQMPVIELNKLYVKNTGEIITGIDAIIN